MVPATNKTYHVVVKKTEGAQPQKMVVSATNIKKAIDLMVLACSANSTSDLVEFEILEILGRDQYRVAAKKLPNKVKPHIQVATKIDTAVLDDDPMYYEENSYKPYRTRMV